MRTQVGIVGAGPAGLLLSQLLHLNGIESVVLEKQSREYCEARIRAGVLESGTVELLREAQVAERMEQQKLLHGGIEIAYDGKYRYIDFVELTGRDLTIWGQTQIVRDLNKARSEAGGNLVFEALDVAIHDFDTDAPRITYTKDGESQEVHCDFIAGCDGYHGVCRTSVRADRIDTFERVYPFGWLGILVEKPPVSDELIYAHSERGYALFSMRSPTLSRLYIQCAADENLDEWPDERIYEELRLRGGDRVAAELEDAPSIEKSIAPLRSFVAEPLRHGNLFLAGDAAHIVPPTGAKGLNLAAADIRILYRALVGFYKSKRTDLLDAYSATCLKRIWNAQRFSWWMTSMLHLFPDSSPYERRLQISEIDYVTGSRAASTALAENYVGLPFD
jgi:p-hydroxybenzoate 3-monooxygenase